nr:uncharacterized protein LOC127311625 isoform X2 [Lolium perenne]
MYYMCAESGNCFNVLLVGYLHTHHALFSCQLCHWPKNIKSSLPTLLKRQLMESPAGPSSRRKLPGVYIVKPKLEPGDDSLPAPLGDGEDKETNPSSRPSCVLGSYMSRLQKPCRLVIRLIHFIAPSLIWVLLMVPEDRPRLGGPDVLVGSRVSKSLIHPWITSFQSMPLSIFEWCQTGRDQNTSGHGTKMKLKPADVFADWSRP